jgi:hypothetical protein
MAFINNVDKSGHFKSNPNWKQEQAELEQKAQRDQEAQKQENERQAVVQELVDALKEQTPPGRTFGECWCIEAWDIDTLGHSSGCIKARDALERAKPFRKEPTDQN